MQACTFLNAYKSYQDRVNKHSACELTLLISIEIWFV